MFENVSVLIHNCVKLVSNMVVYVDPFQLTEHTKDADIILVTHDHYDHYSPEDIEKIAKEDTLLILPACMKNMEIMGGVSKVDFIEPGEELAVNDVVIKAVRAYNIGKQFHPKEKDYVGYVVTMGGNTYYVAGDTDDNEDVYKVKCDVAFLPVGGTYTMNYEQAAKVANYIKPKLAIPTHYGTITGETEDGKKFSELVDESIEVRVMI